MPVRLVELLILYARVQFYTPRASDYRLFSKTNNINIIRYVRNPAMMKYLPVNVQYTVRLTGTCGQDPMMPPLFFSFYFLCITV
jgi:hypothetical protein